MSEFQIEDMTCIDRAPTTARVGADRVAAAIRKARCTPGAGA